MADNVGVTTRLQRRKLKENEALQIGSSKKSSKKMVVPCDEENLNIVSCGVHSRRSFPLQHESDQWHKNSKKTFKTETSTKQRRTLCARGDNYSSDNYAAFTAQHTRPQECAAEDYIKSSHKVSRNETSMDRDVYSYFVGEDSGHNPKSVAMDSDIIYFLGSNTVNIPVPASNLESCHDSAMKHAYSEEIMEYLMWIEADDLLQPGFLDNSPDVTSTMRGVLMDWLLQVQNNEDLMEETLHLSVAMIDRCLNLIDVKMPNLQLVGITCLFIASKFNERFAPEISTLCYLTANTFEKKQVLTLERTVLQILQFKLTSPVSITFLESYLQVHEDPPQVKYLAMYLLDLSITNLKFASVLPSLKASSALYLARLIILETKSAWTPDLAYYTKYTVDELQDLTNDFINLLARACDSKFQGARNKYNSDEYDCISHCERLHSERMIVEKSD